MIDRYAIVEKAPSHRGKNEYLKHLSGERLTLRQQILGKCYDCMGYYGDGAVDCRVFSCALYPTMPYRKEGVSKSRVLTPEQKEKMVEQLKRGRESKKGKK